MATLLLPNGKILEYFGINYYSAIDCKFGDKDRVIVKKVDNYKQANTISFENGAENFMVFNLSSDEIKDMIVSIMEEGKYSFLDLVVLDKLTPESISEELPSYGFFRDVVMMRIAQNFPCEFNAMNNPDDSAIWYDDTEGDEEDFSIFN